MVGCFGFLDYWRYDRCSTYYIKILIMGFDVFSAGVFFFAYPLLLSAVDMIMVLMLACGIGIAGIFLALLTLTSVLDLLYLKYTLRNLVWWLGLN